MQNKSRKHFEKIENYLFILNVSIKRRSLKNRVSLLHILHDRMRQFKASPDRHVVVSRDHTGKQGQQRGECAGSDPVRGSARGINCKNSSV